MNKTLVAALLGATLLTGAAQAHKVLDKDLPSNTLLAR